MRIASLYGTLSGRPAFVVGTGPSMRCFPLSVLRGQYLIGLNQAWKYADAHGVEFDLMVTVHPELCQEYEAAGRAGRTRWVVKKKPPMADLSFDDPRRYVFLTRADLGCVAERPDDTLYLGEGVQCTAMDLAARLGADPVVLVGVDMTSLDGDYHGHDQHVRWLGLAPEEQYALYRGSAAAVRSLLRDRFGVRVLTLSPFLGADAAREDYVRLKAELGLKPLPPPPDVSPYFRRPPRPSGPFAGGRYGLLYELLAARAGPGRGAVYLEVGTFDGRRAADLCGWWKRLTGGGRFVYYGFDLFEFLTPERAAAELSKSRLPPPAAAVRRTLAACGAEATLVVGDTRQTLPAFADGPGRGLEPDLVFVDGGHSPETVASDWRAVSRLVGPGTVVVFDDYYDNKPGWGCRDLVDALAADPAWLVDRGRPPDRVPGSGLVVRAVAVCRAEGEGRAVLAAASGRR